MKASIILGLLSQVVMGHSNMFSPAPRGNQQWWGYCSRGWKCNTACDSPKAQSPFNSIYNEKRYVKRGDTIPVEWLRQNHPGGFVRISFSTFDNSDESGAFDSNSAKYVCYETNCREDGHDPILGLNNGPGSQKCSTSVKIPDNLPDGPITLQWTWFGGGVLFADQRASFANYVSCSDMVLQGGSPYNPHKISAEFQGGDAVTTNPQQCRYWSTNSVFGCPNGAEDNNKAGCGYGEPKFGAPAEWSGNNNSGPDSPIIRSPETPAPEVPAPAQPETPAPEVPAPTQPETPAPEVPAPAQPETPAPEVPTPAQPETPAPEVLAPEVPTVEGSYPTQPPTTPPHQNKKCHRRPRTLTPNPTTY